MPCAGDLAQHAAWSLWATAARSAGSDRSRDRSRDCQHILAHTCGRDDDPRLLCRRPAPLFPVHGASERTGRGESSRETCSGTGGEQDPALIKISLKGASDNTTYAAPHLNCGALSSQHEPCQPVYPRHENGTTAGGIAIARCDPFETACLAGATRAQAFQRATCGLLNHTFIPQQQAFFSRLFSGGYTLLCSVPHAAFDELASPPRGMQQSREAFRACRGMIC